MGQKTRPTHMLSARDSLQLGRHLDGKERGGKEMFANKGRTKKLR